MHLSYAYLALLSIFPWINCFKFSFSPSTYSCLNFPFSKYGLNTMSSSISIHSLLKFSCDGKKLLLMLSIKNLIMWLFPLFSTPQSKLAPYIFSKFLLISSCVVIFFVPRLRTDANNAFWVIVFLSKLVVKKIANKFVLNLFVFILWTLTPFFMFSFL